MVKTPHMTSVTLETGETLPSKEVHDNKDQATLAVRPAVHDNSPTNGPISQMNGQQNQVGGQRILPSRLAFSVKETAEILGVSEKTVRRLVSRRLLRASRALRHL